MRNYNPQIGEIWQHYKVGKYQILYLAQDVTRVDQKVPVVIYKATQGDSIYCRRLKNFMSTVEVEGEIRYRFERL